MEKKWPVASSRFKVRAMMTDSYIAAFFEAEGTVGTPVGSSNLSAVIPSTDLEVLESIRVHLAGHGIESRIYVRKLIGGQLGKKQQWSFQVMGRPHVTEFYRLIIPYMNIRRKKASAQDLLRYLKLFPCRIAGQTKALLSREQALDRMAQGWKPNHYVPPLKTHCINGHEFTPENTWTSKKNGKRNCKACGKIRQLKYTENGFWKERHRIRKATAA